MPSRAKPASQVDYDTSLGLKGQASALLATEQASADLTVPGTSENFAVQGFEERG